MNRSLKSCWNSVAGLLLIATSGSMLCAQTNTKAVPADGPASPSNSPNGGNFPRPFSSSSSSQSTAPPQIAPSTNRAESSLFYFLNMSGRTRADFTTLESNQRIKFYAKGLFGPFIFFSAATSAGTTQAMGVPESWGQGAEGYGHRFGNYLARQAVQRSLRWAGEVMLHEDNRYFQSGEHGTGRRIVYALKSSVMARGNDGNQHVSISQIGSIAGASFISRLWQPSTNNSAGDGAVSFGIGMGVNAGLSVLREFLPDVTRHVFLRNPQNTHRAPTSP
jgi:hypothetical protein